MPDSVAQALCEMAAQRASSARPLKISVCTWLRRQHLQDLQQAVAQHDAANEPCVVVDFMKTWLDMI